MRLREIFDNRIGRFSLKVEAWHEKDKWLLKEIFSLMVVVRCECLEYDNKYEYYAYSDLFDKTKEGDTIPSYEILAKEDVVDGVPVYSVKTERIK